VRPRPLAALAVLALIGAGCSGAPTETGTATGTQSPAESSQAVKFSRCMRDNGVKDFPDPDASGELTIDAVVNGSSLDPDAPAFKRAVGACQDLRPSGFTGHTRDSTQQDAALAFARCMREHGVADFPDPAKDQPLVDTNRIPSTAREGGMTILNAAMDKCGDRAAEAMGKR
jgi:hypothetical protein